MAADGHAPHFTFISDSTLGGRLLRAVGEGWRELSAGPAAYLNTALSLDRFKHWLPVRFFRELAVAVPAIILHPVKFFQSSRATEPLGASPRRLFGPILATIGIIYLGALSYMAYRGILAPFFGINVVSKEYGKIDTATILAPLKYPAQRTQGPAPPQAGAYSRTVTRARGAPTRARERGARKGGARAG